MGKEYRKVLVIPVIQPLGTFYICSMRSNDLLELSYPDTLTITGVDNRLYNPYKLSGNQREQILEKRKEIGRYIDGVEATFPNTVILGANVDENGYPIDDIEQKWVVEEANGFFYLIIPVKKKNARIIDGQHRLTGFEFSEKGVVFDIPCSVYLDLPLPLQASIFATININQKKVDRSLAFELFGYDLEKEQMESWSPEKLAIFITRKLNVDEDSPLKGNIKVVARYNSKLFEGNDWVIATSVFVDGIMSLISSNPKKDRDKLNSVKLEERRRQNLLPSDSSPLRHVYLDYNDKLLYTIILNYFKSVVKLFFNKTNTGYINKTVGIQALFDVLKLLSKDILEKKDLSVSFFTAFLSPASKINFNDLFFQASGIGRSRIKNTIAIAIDLSSIDKIKEKDRGFYNNILQNISSSEQQEKWIWEDEAETVLLRTLVNAKWDALKKVVTISYGIEGEELKFDSYDDFYSKLVEIAAESVKASLLRDPDMGDLISKFDSEELVTNILADYHDRLVLIGWNG